MSAAERGGGRANQLHRTRKDLLQAAARLLREGGQPSLEDVARAAMVSRATAYRHFPDVAALLAEAALDVDTPQAERVLAGASADPVARLGRVDAAIEAMIAANEPALRIMLRHSLDASLRGAREANTPLRQNRRTPLIEAALAPVAAKLTPASRRMLVRSLALVIGTEARLVLKDVLQLEDAEARRVRRWAIAALVAAALGRRSAGRR